MLSLWGLVHYDFWVAPDAHLLPFGEVVVEVNPEDPDSDETFCRRRENGAHPQGFDWAIQRHSLHFLQEAHIRRDL